MRTPGDFPVHLRNAPFTRAAALAAGLSGSRLRSRDVIRVGRGVYRWTGTPGSTTTPTSALPSAVRTPPLGTAGSATPSAEGRAARETRKEASRRREVERLHALLARHPDLVVTGASAARLWGLPLPSWVEASTELTVLRGDGLRACADAGVRTRLADLARVQLHPEPLHGLPVTSYADTWFHLADDLPVDQLVAVGDRLVRSRPRRGEDALTDRAALAECLRRQRGRRGVVKGRAAHALVRDGADSPQETALRLALLDAGLPEPELQIELRDPAYSTRHPATADLGYRRWRIAVQYEGAGHDDPVQVARDTQRDAVFQRAGWTVIRVSNSDRRAGFAGAIALIRQAIAARRLLEAAAPGNPLHF